MNKIPSSGKRGRGKGKPWEGGLAAILALEDPVFWVDQEVLGVAKAATTLRHQFASLELNGLARIESVINRREYFNDKTDTGGW